MKGPQPHWQRAQALLSNLLDCVERELFLNLFLCQVLVSDMNDYWLHDRLDGCVQNPGVQVLRLTNNLAS